MRLFTAATFLSIGTVAFLALAVPRLERGFSEAEIRRELVSATAGDALDGRVMAALEDGDVDLALQYAAVARELQTALAPETLEALDTAQGTFATVVRNAGDFAGAYVTGHADSAAGLAGAVISDLTVVGDVRDIVREGGRAAVGEDYSEFLLTLAAIGIAAEAITIASGGTSLTVKAAVSVLKVAHRTGNLTADFAGRLVRLARAATREGGEAVEVASLSRTVPTPGGVPTPGDTPVPAGALPLTQAAARAELRSTLTAVTAVAANAGAADAVKLMRTVRTVDDARDLATFTSRFGRTSRAVVELTGKTALRGFRVAVRGLRLLIAFLWSFIAWVAGLLALSLLRRVWRACVAVVRGLFFTVAVP